MGNRISISQPAVIHTELRPLDESFWIGANGQLEQWYNENDNVFAPDRTVTPLTLSPHLSVKDGDTGNGYSTESSPSTLTFQYVTWKVKEWDGTEYVETTITSTTNTDPYYKSGNNLVVQKNNYDPTHAITITCEVRYNDPRDVGAMNDTQGSTMLVTSVDATAVYPVIDIANPSARSFNPLKDEPIYEFDASADFPTTSVGDKGAQCPVDPMGTEEVVMGTNSIAPTLTIQYGDGIGSTTQQNQTFVRRQTSGGAVSSIHGDVSFIKSVKGNAVSWSQLIQNGDFSDGLDYWIPWSTEQTTTVSDGVCYMELLPNVTQGAQQHEINHVAGHKYYIHSLIKGDAPISNDPLFFYTDYVTERVYYTPSTSWQKISEIRDFENGILVISFVRTNLQLKDVYMIDLTLLFGAGNEPSTVEAFDAWLANNIGAADYYPYNAGELLPCKLTGIKTTATNPNREFTRNLDVTKLYGKNSQGNYVQMFPNGMRSAGSVHDVVDLENATADVNVGARFFNGTENWSLNETYTANHEFNLEIGDWAVSYLSDANAACNLYALGKNYDGSVIDDGADGMWTVFYGLLFFNDSRFTTVQGWKDHLAALYAANTPLGYYFDLSQPIHYTDVVYRSGGADTPVSKLFGSFEWYGVNSSGQEVPIDTLPIYTNAPQPTNGGQHTESIRINALYGKEIPVFLRVKRHPWDASVLPPKVTKSVAWKIPPIDVVVVSDKGSAVRSTHIPVGQTAEDFTFSTIVNQQGEVISDAKKADNMVFKWYYVKYATNGQAIIPTGETSPEVYVGSGQTQTISAATLKNTKPVGGESTSTSVFCEAYLLGAYHLVNGQWVRTIDE